MDMVCEKEKDCNLDMDKEGLRLYVDGDFLKAEGTTLGGDDGIAVHMRWQFWNQMKFPIRN